MPDPAPVPARSRNVTSGLFARLGGLLMDLLLLGLFLLLGVATLDILIRVVVVVVGYVQMANLDPRLVELNLVKVDPNRHREDWLRLGLSVGATVLFLGLFVVGLKARRWLLERLIDASFESFVSKRYLLSRSEGNLVNLITMVSVLGVSVGVMALVVVISVMNGFDRILVDRMMGVFSHIEVYPYFSNEGFTEETANGVIETALSHPEVVAAAPVASIQTFFQADTGINESKVGAMLRGFDLEREKAVTRMTDPASIRVGTGTPGYKEVVLGNELARKLGVTLEDKVYALGNVIATARGPQPKILPLKVTGIFSTGIYNVDENLAYTNLETVQALALSEDQVSHVHIKVRAPDHAQTVKLDLNEQLADGERRYYVRTWDEINPEFFEALWVEKVAMFIILLLIVLVASLNIIGTLVMKVTQKTREIGILKSMGATGAMILRMFLYHGLFIGLVGTALGTAWGLWLCEFVEHDIDKIFKLPEAVYGLDRLPVIIEWPVIGFLTGSCLLICLLASIIPAWKASRLDPVVALRYD